MAGAPPADSTPPIDGEGATPEFPPMRQRHVRRTVVLLVAAALVVFVVAYAIGRVAAPDTSSGVANRTAPGASGSVAPSLAALILEPRDATSAVSVQLLPGGTQVQGQTTLDLCNGSFPSEALRTGRVQDVAVDGAGQPVLSTEAVEYRGADATSQAFRELKAAAAACPATPVVSPVGEPTVTTKFEQAPDASWPTTPSVERLAFSFTTTDDSGRSVHSIAVYLRRANFLLGLYFNQPDVAQPAIEGRTTVAGIVANFERRLARLKIHAEHV
jgi:hypothetical protein